MKRKKLFGIGAVILLVLVTYVPVANGIHNRSESNNDFTRVFNKSYGWEYDLTVDIESCKYKDLRNSNDAVYEIKYSITNVGSTLFEGGEIVCEMKNNDYNFGNWTVGVESLIPGETTQIISKEIILFSSSNEIEDEEHYLAGESFSLEIDSGDSNCENDISTSFGNFGWDGIDYLPTYTQITSVMKSIENMSNEDLGGLLTAFKQRLGWVYDASLYAIDIIDTGFKLLYESLLVGVVITTELYIIIDWIKEIYIFLQAPNPFSLDQILKDSAEAIGALIAIWSLIAMHQGIESLLLAWEEFSTVTNNTIKWVREKHWNNPIALVHGDIIGERLGQKKVHVICRDQENDFRNYFKFNNLDPTWDGKKAWQRHDCTIYANVDGYEEKHSIPILSWAFSEGIIYYHMDLDRKDKSCRFNLLSFLRNSLFQEIIERWFSYIKPLSYI
ncbi:hypothetical protein AYK24_02225 [Thermoplasmatales archaeon SG8-52-4]|nr:MAG: hypothetical protein AYK24_02225 [Thermoplasmatales archaeon SG8-52-4]